MTARRSALRLELALGDEIAGTITDATGARRSFWGWLELLAALETARVQQCESSAQKSVRRSGAGGERASRASLSGVGIRSWDKDTTLKGVRIKGGSQ